MNNPNLIQQKWAVFRDKVYPDIASAHQLRETRRAFFAGAHTLMMIMFDTLDRTGDPNEVTDRDMQVMDSIDAEFRQFQADLKSGRA